MKWRSLIPESEAKAVFGAAVVTVLITTLASCGTSVLGWRIAIGQIESTTSLADKQFGATRGLAVREDRNAAYSALVGAASGFSESIFRAKLVATGATFHSSGSADVEWDEMRSYYRTLLDAAARTRVSGSTDAINAATRLEQSAQQLRTKLDTLNTRRGSDPQRTAAGDAVDIAKNDLDQARIAFEEVANLELG